MTERDIRAATQAAEKIEAERAAQEERVNEIRKSYKEATRKPLDRLTARDLQNENMDQDVTRSYPEEMYLQADQEIKGFAMGSRKAIKGYKYGGLK